MGDGVGLLVLAELELETPNLFKVAKMYALLYPDSTKFNYPSRKRRYREKEKLIFKHTFKEGYVTSQEGRPMKAQR